MDNFEIKAGPKSEETFFYKCFSSSVSEQNVKQAHWILIKHILYLWDLQSVLSWSKILMTLPQRSGLESSGHKVIVGKTMSSIGKVRTTDLIGFSYHPASLNCKYKAKWTGIWNRLLRDSWMLQIKPYRYECILTEVFYFPIHPVLWEC